MAVWVGRTGSRWMRKAASLSAIRASDPYGVCRTSPSRCCAFRRRRASTRPTLRSAARIGRASSLPSLGQAPFCGPKCRHLGSFFTRMRPNRPERSAFLAPRVGLSPAAGQKAIPSMPPPSQCRPPDPNRSSVQASSGLSAPRDPALIRQLSPVAHTGSILTAEMPAPGQQLYSHTS